VHHPLAVPGTRRARKNDSQPTHLADNVDEIYWTEVSVVPDPDPPPPVFADGQGTRPCAGLELDPSDGQLLDRIADGDAGAVAVLYDRYSRLTYTLARRVCEDQNLAEEAVYQVFLSIWRNPRRFDEARGRFTDALLALTHREAVYALCKRPGVPSAPRVCRYSARVFSSGG
jgi:Sigma-70 region 2